MPVAGPMKGPMRIAPRIARSLAPGNRNDRESLEGRSMRKIGTDQGPAFLLCFFLLSQALPALAEPIHIVALGASGTAGKGVGPNQAFPAQLEGLLRATGYDVRVANAGINGNTTSDMLDRLDSDVPAGTQIVIFQPSSNDQKMTKRRAVLPDAVTRQHVETILARLKARHIEVILFAFLRNEGADLAEKYGALFYGRLHRRGVPREDVLSDGKHLSPEGYAIVAQNLVPLVEQLVARLQTPR